MVLLLVWVFVLFLGKEWFADGFGFFLDGEDRHAINLINFL